MRDNKNCCILCNSKNEKIICDDCYNKVFNKSKTSYDNNTIIMNLFGFMSSDERKLIYEVKTKNNKRLQKFLSNELSNLISKNVDKELLSNSIITYIPRRAEGIRAFRFDHKEIICEMVAKNLQIKNQKLFDFQKTNDSALSYAKIKLPNVKSIIIIDDHIESGNTIKRAVELSYGMGANNVIVAVLSK